MCSHFCLMCVWQLWKCAIHISCCRGITDSLKLLSSLCPSPRVHWGHTSCGCPPPSVMWPSRDINSCTSRWYVDFLWLVGFSLAWPNLFWNWAANWDSHIQTSFLPTSPSTGVRPSTLSEASPVSCFLHNKSLACLSHLGVFSLADLN